VHRRGKKKESEDTAGRIIHERTVLVTRQWNHRLLGENKKREGTEADHGDARAYLEKLVESAS